MEVFPDLRFARKARARHHFGRGPAAHQRIVVLPLLADAQASALLMLIHACRCYFSTLVAGICRSGAAKAGGPGRCWALGARRDLRIDLHLADRPLNAQAAECPTQRSGPRFRIIKRLSRSEEHTSELQSRGQLVCRLLPEKKKRYREGTEASGEHSNLEQVKTARG